MIFAPAGFAEHGLQRLDGNPLTMMDNDETYDFDGDDVEEDANSVMVLERQ